MYVDCDLDNYQEHVLDKITNLNLMSINGPSISQTHVLSTLTQQTTYLDSQ